MIQNIVEQARPFFLYHGGTEAVEKPEVRTASRPVDFGDGFYTTSDFEQAAAFAKIRSDLRKTESGFVSVYEIDESRFADFAILKFKEPNEEWFGFVIDCRRGGKLFKKYDLIIGPVANDRVFRVLDFYEAGVYTKEHAIKELLPYRLSNQYAFFNKDLASKLKFIEYPEIKK
ncbi:MAG: DUF3990 domain-containing protein [Chitinispirillales bacterium]|jgi:hypothetical protein|nr:DUF3990 domain-containing protein [Chitinispirillales bacterium]